MAARIYTDELTIRNVSLYKGTQNPNGIVQAQIGSMFIDDSGAVPLFWRNLDGGTLWSAVSITSPIQLTFEPGGTDGDLVFSDWNDLMQVHDFFGSSDKEILFSNAIATPQIPAGTYDFSRTALKGLLNSSVLVPQMTVEIEDGTVFSALGRVVENLRLERLPGASGVPIMTIATAGIKRAYLKNSSLVTQLGSSAAFIRIAHAGARIIIDQEDGELDAQEPTAPIVTVLTPGAWLTWRPIRSKNIGNNDIAAIAGTTVFTRFRDADSQKLKQIAVLGSEYVYGPFPDGGFDVTYAPSNPDPGGFVYNSWEDALDLLQKLPADIRKVLSVDDTFIGGAGNPIVIPAAVHRLPAKTWIQAAASRFVQFEQDMPVLEVADGGTLSSDDDTFRFNGLKINHVGSVPVISSTSDLNIEMASSIVEVKAVATAAWQQLSAGQKQKLALIGTEFRKESGATESVVEVGGGVGGDITLELKGRTVIGRDTLQSLAPIGTGSSTANDPTVTIEPQRRWQMAAAQALKGVQANKAVRVARRMTVLHKIQLQSLLGTPTVHQAALWWMRDATLPSPGDTFVLDDNSGAPPETWTWALAPAPFQVVIGVDIPTTYANLVASILADSAKYSAVLAYDMEKWTAATAAPGMAVIISALTQAVEDAPHEIYGVQATGLPVMGDFQNPMDYSDVDPIAMPAAATGDRNGFGWGTSAAMQDGIELAVLEGRLSYVARRNAAAAIDCWQRLTDGNPKIENPTALGAYLITKLTRMVVGDWSAAGAGVASVDLPPLAQVPEMTPIRIRRKDGNGGVTTLIAPTPPELINGAATQPLPTTSSATVMHDGVEWFIF